MHGIIRERKRRSRESHVQEGACENKTGDELYQENYGGQTDASETRWKRRRGRATRAILRGLDLSSLNTRHPPQGAACTAQEEFAATDRRRGGFYVSGGALLAGR